MIKKAIFLKTISDRVKIPIHLFKFDPPIKSDDEKVEAEYIIGGFYKNLGYSMSAFYKSDSEGIKISEQHPVITEEGVNTFEEIFEKRGYILL